MWGFKVLHLDVGFEFVVFFEGSSVVVLGDYNPLYSPFSLESLRATPI